MNILGLSAYYHDSAACLLRDGEIVAAAQEERFTQKNTMLDSRRTQPPSMTSRSSSSSDSLETYLAFAPRGFLSFSKSMPIWLKDKFFQKATIVSELRETLSKDVGWIGRLLFPEHNLSHAASAFYPSPFHEAAVLTRI